jgi:hypothetical protein
MKNILSASYGRLFAMLIICIAVSLILPNSLSAQTRPEWENISIIDFIARKVMGDHAHKVEIYNDHHFESSRYSDKRGEGYYLLPQNETISIKLEQPYSGAQIKKIRVHFSRGNKNMGLNATMKLSGGGISLNEFEPIVADNSIQQIVDFYPGYRTGHYWTAPRYEFRLTSIMPFYVFNPEMKRNNYIHLQQIMIYWYIP